MTAPSLLSTYPNNGDTGIPVGITIKLYFSCGIDSETLKNSVVLYGRDFDFTSGPDTAIWVDKDTGDNPYFLSSPGFKGLIPLKFALGYYTLGTTTEVDPGVIESQADEVTANVGTVASITIDPKYNTVLPASTELTLVVAGDPNSQGTGVSARTVFDVVADSGNTGNGVMSVWGTWIDNGAADDELNILVTGAGTPATAVYKYWYTSNGVGSAVTNITASRKYRSLVDGLQIRFTGSTLSVGDKWTFSVKAIERLTTNTTIVFTTNDGSYTVAPASPSTPATSLPPSSVLPENDNIFEIIQMLPENGSYNISVKNRKIVITFSEPIDASTITNDSVKLYKYPVDGVYDDTYSPVELQKTIDVNSDEITIRF